MRPAHHQATNLASGLLLLNALDRYTLRTLRTSTAPGPSLAASSSGERQAQVLQYAQYFAKFTQYFSNIFQNFLNFSLSFA